MENATRRLPLVSALAGALLVVGPPAAFAQTPAVAGSSGYVAQTQHVVQVESIGYSAGLIRTRVGKNDNWVAFSPSLSATVRLRVPDGMKLDEATARVEAVSVRPKVCNATTQGNNDKWGCFEYFDSDYLPTTLRIHDLGNDEWELTIADVFEGERNSVPYAHTGNWRLTELYVAYGPHDYWDYFEAPDLESLGNPAFKLRRTVRIGLRGSSVSGHRVELKGRVRHHVAVVTYRNRYINQMRPLAGRTVEVWHVGADGQERHLRDIRTDRTGRFLVRVDGTRGARWFLRYPGDGANAPSRSAAVRAG